MALQNCFSFSSANPKMSPNRFFIFPNSADDCNERKILVNLQNLQSKNDHKNMMVAKILCSKNFSWRCPKTVFLKFTNVILVQIILNSANNALLLGDVRFIVNMQWRQITDFYLTSLWRLKIEDYSKIVELIVHAVISWYRDYIISINLFRLKDISIFI